MGLVVMPASSATGTKYGPVQLEHQFPKAIEGPQLASAQQISYGEIMKGPLPTAVCTIGGCLFLLRASPSTAAEDECLSLGTPIRTNNVILLPLSGESAVTYYLESSTDLHNWTRILTNSDVDFARTLATGLPGQMTFYRASRDPLPLFAAGLTVSTNIDFLGNNITVDSYDSSDPNHSTNGMYNAATRMSGGDVWCSRGLVNVGNGNIFGHLRLAPGGSYALGPNGSVGDLPANWPAQSGIESGWLALDYRFCILDVAAPFYSGLPLPQAANSHYSLASTNYFIAGNLTLTNGDVLLIDGRNSNLYVTGSFLMHSGSTIVITNGGSFKLYVGSFSGPATSCNLSQVSTFGNATAFKLFGLPTTESLTWNGNTQFVGTVYSPQAGITLGAGGPPAYDYQGAVIAGSLSFNGHFSFHFDQYLKQNGPTR
jgi:hypothetical protein